MWTTFAETAVGCTCEPGPTYYVVVRDGSASQKIRVGASRRDAQRALRKIGVAVDDGLYRPQRNAQFAQWAAEWLTGFEGKPSTRRSYESTVKHANRLFGRRRIRDIRPDDISTLSTQLRDKGLSASTRAKHLRVLHGCFSAAIEHDYATRNPVAALPKGLKPRAARREAAYFEDAELAVLLPNLPAGSPRMICELALRTGIRQGEILALRWSDVDLGTATIRVRRSITDGIVGTPKSHEARDVDLTRDVVELLGVWWGECGSPTAPDAPVFVGDHGAIAPSTVLKHLYRAMTAAGIPREGPTGERRTFHSLRHSFARIALERGATLAWLSRHLGHSGISVTDRVYAHLARDERKRQAERLEGAFAFANTIGGEHEAL